MSQEVTKAIKDACGEAATQIMRTACCRLTTTGGRQPFGTLQPAFQHEDIDLDLPATSLDAPLFVACGSTYCDSGIALPTIDLIPGRL